MYFEVCFENKSSYAVQVAAPHRRVGGSKHRRPVLLVRCDRLDPKDNERGLRLAERLAEFLGSLPGAEQKALVADKMVPLAAE
jgi:hypothetical protein